MSQHKGNKPAVSLVRKQILKGFGVTCFIWVLCSQGCKLPDTNKLKIAWHNLIARDNIWFNANESVKEAKMTLRLQHEDKFDKILEVFPFGSESQKKAMTPTMDEAIKRGQKIMARHYISRWMDEAYLIAGQAQFLKGDFATSIETFQYLNTRYKNSPLRYEAMLWICQNYLALGKTEDAESLMSLIQSERKFPQHYVGVREALLAQIEIKLEKYKPAVKHLKQAIQSLDPLSKYEKGRYSYILAQLYQKLEIYDSANIYFRRCIKYNPPYEMAFNAKMNLAKAYNANKPGEARSIKRYLKRMLRDDKNITYFDQIYYELGLISLREKNEPEAIYYFRLSAASSKGNKDQKAKTFLALAEYFFGKKPKPDYRNAQMYFDSAASSVSKEHPDYERIIDKKAVLGDLIKNLMIIEEQDSLLKLALIPTDKLDKLIDKMVEEQKLKKVQSEQNNTLIQNTPPPAAGSGGSGFYFTNPALLASGQADFNRRFGERKNTDFWAIASKAADVQNQINDSDNPEDSASLESDPDNQSNPLYKNADADRKKILNKIPFTSKAKAESELKIADAMANVGMIYNENLSDYEAAADVLKNLLLHYPKYKALDKVLYQLYKVSKELKDDEEADRYRKWLIEKFPLSSYTKIILGKSPTNGLTEAGKEAVAFYQESYQLYASGKYAEVLLKKKEADKKFSGSTLQPKYELLYALSLAKTDSVQVFERQLNYINGKYSGTDEAASAGRMLEIIRKRRERPSTRDSVENATNANPVKAQKKKAVYESEYSSHYYVVLLVPANFKKMEELKIKISDLNQTGYIFDNLEVKHLFFDQTYQMVRVVEFKDRGSVLKYIEDIRLRKSMFDALEISDYQLFGITEDNFMTLFSSKDWETYIEFFANKF